MFIYKITNKINGKCYVGQTTQAVEHRFYEHCYKNSKSAINNAIKKYGKDNFIVEIISECSSKNELLKQETFYIKSFNTIYPNGYNLTTGGEFSSPSESVRQKISISLSGKKRPEEVCKKISESKSGKKVAPCSEERKIKIGLANRGRKHSEETRKKISQKRKGIKPKKSRFFSEIQKKEMSKTGKKQFRDGKLNHLLENAKKQRISIICVENGKTYPSIKSAAEEIKTSASNIVSVLKGRYKQIKGFSFKYWSKNE